jgi:hypothetical protein
MDQNLSRIRDQTKLIGLPPDWTREQLMTHQWGQQSLSAWRRMQDVLLRVGSLTRKTDPASLFDDQFNAYANGFDRAQIVAMAEK